MKKAALLSTCNAICVVCTLVTIWNAQKAHALREEVRALAKAQCETSADIGLRKECLAGLSK